LEQVSFQGANLDESDLTGADLAGADLTDATLTDADLTSADLRGIHWEHIADVKNANIAGVKNAPQGFVDWAVKHGALQQVTGTKGRG
jgi:uncharacterized protein YjbI with pentapeptide repeats